MARLLPILLATTFTLLLVLSSLHQTEAKIKLKKLLKAGLVLGALGSRKLPTFLPIPLPIPIRFNEARSFGGGHYGRDYYHSLGSERAPALPAFGSGGYHLGAGGFGGGAYGGGGYTAEGGWW